MQNKTLIALAVLATVLCSGMLLSTVAAQEDKVDPTTGAVDPSNAPDAPFIAPAPDSNTTSTDDESLYHITDENRTAVDDAQEPTGEDANLIYTNTAAESPDNTLAIAAIVALSVVIAAGAVGAVYYRRNASKQQI